MSKRENFSTKLTFIMSSIGASIGLGILWMFPFKLCKYGGAAFLIPYFLFTIVLGVVGLIIELTCGRYFKSGTMLGIRNVFNKKNKKGGVIIGLIPTLGMLTVFSFYTVITGWIVKYLYISITGEISHITPAIYFNQFAGSNESLMFSIIALLLLTFVISLGVSNGIEKLNKVAIPAMFIIFILITIRSVTLPNAMAGVRYMLVPDFKVLLNIETWIMAMGLAFFTSSLSGSVMVVYGSYIDEKVDIPKSALTIILFNTIGAILSAFAIIPAVFSFGIDLKSGPSLLFISLPLIFSSLPFSLVISTIFFTCVISAAISTAVAMMEVPVEAIMSNLNIKRKIATLITCLLALIIIIPISLNINLFESVVDITSIIVSPLSVIILSIIIFWHFKGKSLIDEINIGSKYKVGKRFLFISKYVFIPLTVLIIILGVAYGGIG